MNRCKFWPRLSWQPFRSYCDRWVEHNANDGLPVANLNEIAAAVGATFAQVRRGHDTGHIQFHSADRWACRLGVHPSVIWGDEYWQVSEAIDVHADEVMQRRRRRMSSRVVSEVVV